MTYIFQSIYYSIRNLALYREAREANQLTSRLPQRLQEGMDLNGMRYVITDVMLSGFGLKVVEGSNNQIPRGVWLTSAQREVISMVNEHGYWAGLR